MNIIDSNRIFPWYWLENVVPVHEYYNYNSMSWYALGTSSHSSTTPLKTPSPTRITLSSKRYHPIVISKFHWRLRELACPIRKQNAWLHSFTHSLPLAFTTLWFSISHFRRWGWAASSAEECHECYQTILSFLTHTHLPPEAVWNWTSVPWDP